MNRLKNYLLAALANDQQPWLRCAARQFWALLSALGAGLERVAQTTTDK